MPLLGLIITVFVAAASAAVDPTTQADLEMGGRN